jgi:DNA/RNA endonuclease G (NUC1)
MRLTVITGPIFKANDPKYQNKFMDAPVRIPLEFWKVCALIRDDGTLSATAFVLSQDDIQSLPGSRHFSMSRRSRRRSRTSSSARVSSSRFSRDHDHLAAGGAPGDAGAGGAGGHPASIVGGHRRSS